MDPSKLADRLRAIVAPKRVRLEPDGTPGAGADDVTSSLSPTNEDGEGNRAAGSVDRVLGGEWTGREGLSCLVVERRYAPETVYGGDRVKAMAVRLAGASAEAPLVMRGAPARPPFVFFDLETTGLSGGAGTYAFLVGCGSFDEDGGFRTRQFLLLRHADELQLLQAVGAELGRAGALVSFNGKSFDAPLIETRHLFHRIDWTGGGLPHLDVLHPARRFWGDGGVGETSCSLAALEGQVLGARRTGDVPGFEIPPRYFQFVRSGDARPLAGVLEHNRLDLLSLAGLTARLLDLVRTGAARHPREALALGRVYAGGGLDGRAREAYHRALGLGTAHADASTLSIKAAALRSLALLSRRSRRHDDAAVYWRELLGLAACPLRFAREASEALAVHHEHRVRDLPAAKAFALRSLSGLPEADERPSAGWNQAVRHRLERIERKMNKPQLSSFKFETTEPLSTES